MVWPTQGSPASPGPLPGMLLAQLIVTTISRSKRSQRVATAGRCPSGPAGSGMAYSFSGSTTSRWDTNAFTGAAVTEETLEFINLPILWGQASSQSQSPCGLPQQLLASRLRHVGQRLFLSPEGSQSVCGQVLRVRKPFPVSSCTTQALTQKKMFSKTLLGGN